jgi:hypothetical protein
MKGKVARRAKAKRRSPLLPGLLVVGGIALVGLAAFALLSGNRQVFVPEVTGAAALRVDHTEEDLGDVPLGHSVRVAFEVSNVGDRQLRFTAPPYVEVVEGC